MSAAYFGVSDGELAVSGRDEGGLWGTNVI